MQLAMATFLGADGPRTAGILSTWRERIVGSLATFAADRMNGRQVNDVEAHLFDVWQHRFAITERPVRLGVRPRGARKELVPSSESCEDRIDDDTEHCVERGFELSVGVARDECSGL